MSLEHPLTRSNGLSDGAKMADGLASSDVNAEFWHALIDEKAAAEFLGLTGRTMQKLRQRGDGPRYVRISSRCLRYRRIDLREYAEARMRTSTSDPGDEAAQ